MAGDRIVVGMSGGVDSSVAALLLKRRGFDVVGLFMKNWEEDDDDEYCSTRQDLIDCASVAEVIGIELEAVNFSAEYKERVFGAFLAEYSAGRTPNPDVLCNAEIKFKAFLDHAVALGAKHIATGHYARVRESAGRFELLKAVDSAKDQSYFLHRLTQAQLARVVRNLLHRRTAVSRVPEPLSAEEARSDAHARGQDRGGAYRALFLYYRPEKRRRHRRHEGIGRQALVRVRQGSREERIDRRAGARPPAAPVAETSGGGSRLGERRGPAGALLLWREDALPPGRRRLSHRPRRRGGPRSGILGAAVGGDAGPVGRALPRRNLPRRRGHSIRRACQPRRLRSRARCADRPNTGRPRGSG